MLGQATRPSDTVAQRIEPAGAGASTKAVAKAHRKLYSRIGRDADLLFGGSGRELRYESGESVATRHEPGGSIFIVLKGVVGLYHDLPSGESDVLGYCFSGDLIAPSRLEGLWGFDAKALIASQLLAVDLTDVRLQRQVDPKLSWVLFETACAELGHRTARFRGYWCLPVRARLAAFLFEVGEGIGRETNRGLAVHLPMFRDEIATYLGTRTETICRILSDWKHKGLIAMDSPRDLYITDSAQLRADVLAK